MKYSSKLVLLLGATVMFALNPIYLSIAEAQNLNFPAHGSVQFHCLIEKAVNSIYPCLAPCRASKVGEIPSFLAALPIDADLYRVFASRIGDDSSCYIVIGRKDDWIKPAYVRYWDGVSHIEEDCFGITDSSNIEPVGFRQRQFSLDDEFKLPNVFKDGSFSIPILDDRGVDIVVTFVKVNSCCNKEYSFVELNDLANRISYYSSILYTAQTTINAYHEGSLRTYDYYASPMILGDSSKTRESIYDGVDEDVSGDGGITWVHQFGGKCLHFGQMYLRNAKPE